MIVNIAVSLFRNRFINMGNDILAILALHLAAAITPGPNTLAVCCAASIGKRRDALAVAAGIALATGLWVAIALLGAGAVIAWNPRLLLGMRAFGAAYLVWVGVGFLLPRAVRSIGPAGGHPLLVGLLTGLTNPFSVAFWLGSFLAAIPETAPNHLYVRIFGLIVLQSAVWYSSLALLFSTILRGRNIAEMPLLRHVAGAVMITIGLNALIPA